MQCANCATDNAPGSKFCTNCGVALEVVCAACGRGCHPAARFCGWCGAPRIAPLSVVEPHGERKQATVLFADIVGSTEMIAGLDAEEAVGRLQPAVDAMAQAVQRFDGTVLGKLGDGLKAIFGAPRAQEGHALLACQAAIAIQEAMASQPSPIRTRVGLHSGEVVAGALNAGSSQEAQGITLHIANRIEQAAEPGGILLSGACRELVGAYCDTRPAGTRVLKGIAMPIEVFRLLGLKPGVASDRFRDESLVQMRGRERELGILKRALLDAEQGAGSAIGIVAVPGIGKSRLCYEFSEWCRARQVDVFEARAHIFGKATPLLPVLELMRALFRITPPMEAATARRQIEEKLLALDPSFVDDLPFLADFLGLPVPELEGQNIDPKARRGRLLSVVQRMVKAAGPRTSVIIFEDLHWLDEPSQDFLESIVKAASGTNFVVVLNYRPTWPCPWLALPHYRQLPLAELDRGDIDGLVRDLTGDDPKLEQMISHVARQSDGNPFFAEELVRALARSGVLTGERGHYRLASSEWHEPVLPPTIEAAIGARLDTLPEREKTLLQVGAVIGKEFPADLAREVAGISEGEARELFGHLCDLDLIKASTTVQGPGFAFRHPLIQEVGYAMQLRSRRISLHAAVADAIAQSDWGYLDEFAGLLSHHYEAAGKMTAAARQLIRSATWIGRTNAGEAFRQSKKTRQLLGSQPGPKDVEMMRALASASVLAFGWRVGMTADEADPYADEALRYAREFADDEAGPEVLMQYGRFKASTGSADAYAALMEEALAMPATDLGRIATIQGCLSQAHWMSGFLSKAEAAADAALRTMAIRRRQGINGIVGLDSPPYTSFDVELWISCLKAQLLVWLGRFDEAAVLLAEAFQAEGTKREAPVVQCIAHLTSVHLACHRNDPVAAHRHAGRIRAYADQSDIPYLNVYALFATARAKTASDDCAGAVRDLQAGLDFAARANAGREYQTHLLAELSYAQYGSGLFDDAAKTAQAAIAMARDRHHRIAECLATMVQGAGIAVGNGGVVNPEAQQYLARAEDLIRVTGATLLTARLQTLRTDMETRLH
ncbi:MAG TPA: AAA family ATPase [Reyranella sp.]|jgi:class 3 adenylate cyclase/tetratricopeptide (TPR) repeat protein|nr:AAA family ATPase [Reyranella sp.]